MSISFDISESLLFRQFSDSESSAIHCISVLHNHVTIAWKSNTQKQYIFRASDSFAPAIRALVRDYNPDEISIGSVIAKARKSGDLEILDNF